MNKTPGFPMINMKPYARDMKIAKGTRGTFRTRTDLPIVYHMSEEERERWDERWSKIDWGDHERDRYPNVSGDHCMDCGARNNIQRTRLGNHICAYCVKIRLGESDEPNPGAVRRETAKERFVRNLSKIDWSK